MDLFQSWIGRGDSRGRVLHLRPVLAFESVDNWCCLYIKPYWHTIPNKKQDNFLSTMRGFQAFSASFAQTMSGPTSRVQGYDYLLWEVGNVQVAGSKHFS